MHHEGQRIRGADGIDQAVGWGHGDTGDAGVAADLEREHEVVSGERLTVVPFDIRAEPPDRLHGPIGIQLPRALVERWQLCGQLRLVDLELRVTDQRILDDQLDVIAAALVARNKSLGDGLGLIPIGERHNLPGDGLNHGARRARCRALRTNSGGTSGCYQGRCREDRRESVAHVHCPPPVQGLGKWSVPTRSS